MITDKKSAVITVDSPTPVAFLNVFEQGDVWVKTNSCLDCPEETRAKCCGNCYWLVKGGYCHWQTGHLKHHSCKPYWCVVAPMPDDLKSNCILEFKCIEGSRKGQIRRVKDKRDTFIS